MSPFIWLACLGLVCSWLNPDHYLPWLAFQSEFVAGTSLSLLLIPLFGTARYFRWPPLALLGIGLAGVVILQACFGLIFFAGDAWMAALYLVAFALAVSAGSTFETDPQSPAPWDALWLALVVAATASVGAQLVQWLGVDGYGYWVSSLPLHGRPSANLAQPNQLATLLMLGIVAALALRQQGRLSSGPALLLVTWLMLGIVLTRSRVAWIEAAILVGWFLSMRKRAQLRHGPLAVCAVAILFVVLQVGFNPLSDRLHLTGNRPLADQTSTNKRVQHWRSLADAASRAPWFGYGWNQVSVAQATVATDHPPTAELIEHSHNLLFDLVIWNGLPCGVAVIVFLIWWFVTRIRALRDSQGAHLMAAVGVVFVHALLEFPLDYAYFLLPVGLMMGGIDGRMRGSQLLRIPRAWIGLVWAGCLAVVAVVAREYMEAEQNFRTFRMESARIGTSSVSSLPPRLILLSQLEAFLTFARMEPRSGLSEADLEQMSRVARRFGFQPVLFRYAVANALNGQPREAQHALKLLCVLYLPDNCREARAAWQAAGVDRYPPLVPIPFPDISSLLDSRPEAGSPQ